MKITPTYRSIEAAVEELHRTLRQQLTFEENIYCKQLDEDDTGSADAEFTVVHALGRVPRHYIYNIDREGVVYDSRRSDWTDTEIYLKCSAANASLTLTIL